MIFGTFGDKYKLLFLFCVNPSRSDTQGAGFMEARQEDVLKREVRAVHMSDSKAFPFRGFCDSIMSTMYLHCNLRT